MKKITLLSLIIFSLSHSVFAQHVRPSGGQKKSSFFLDKIQSKKFASSLKGEIYQHPLGRGATSLPSPNSIWQPGKMISSSWDTLSGSWKFRDSVIYSYNVNGDVTLELRYDIFGLSDQAVYTYNANAKLTEALWQSWNGSSWDNDWKDTYMYDANNNQIQYLSQRWNTSTSSWDNQWKDDYTYNPSNQMTQIIEQTWNDTSWDNEFKADFTYNGNGVLTYLIAYEWNGASWDKDFQIINIVWYQWTGDWWTSLLQSYVEQDWNGASYENAYRETNAYDAQGNIIDYLSEQWQTGAWVTDYETKDIYAYDANNNISQDIYQDWVQWMMAVRNSWKYDYSNYTLYSSINESSSANAHILVYPNPSSGMFNVQCLMTNDNTSTINHQPLTIEVYNVYGEKVYDNNHFQNNSSSPENSGQIDLSAHPDGIYLIQIKTREGVVLKKIAVQK